MRFAIAACPECGEPPAGTFAPAAHHQESRRSYGRLVLLRHRSEGAFQHRLWDRCGASLWPR